MKRPKARGLKIRKMLKDVRLEILSTYYCTNAGV
jgi:hypothetical protein